MSKQQPSRFGRNVVIVVVLVIILLAAWRLIPHHAAAAHAPRAGSAAVPVTMEPAARRNVDIALPALGTVTPEATVTITSRVAGIIESVHFREGQMVKKGDLLAVIDPRPYAAALGEAQGQLARDRAQLANARIDLERYQSAARKHAIPEQQAATQQAAVAADEGTVQLDEASVAAAQVNLDYTRITSPIDGRVGFRNIDPGNNVLANGTTGLVTVTQLAPITVVFSLAQNELPRVLASMAQGDDLRVEAFDRNTSQPLSEGKLLTIDNQVDQTTGTFGLKAIFANPDKRLWPGQFVNLRFIIGVHQNAVTIPDRAVQRGPDGDYVFVVGNDHKVELRTVATEATDEGFTIVTKGLRAGEQVVVDGQYQLENGKTVTVRPMPAEAPTTGPASL